MRVRLSTCPSSLSRPIEHMQRSLIIVRCKTKTSEHSNLKLSTLLRLQRTERLSSSFRIRFYPVEKMMTTTPIQSILSSQRSLRSDLGLRSLQISRKEQLQIMESKKKVRQVLLRVRVQRTTRKQVTGTRMFLQRLKESLKLKSA